jgi:hypothetical protein
MSHGEDSKLSKKQRHSDQGQQETTKKSCDGDVRIHGAVEVHPSPSLIEQHKTDREENATQQNRSYTISKFTLYAVIVYSALTTILVIIGGLQLKRSHDTFQQDQRPYVFSTKVNPAQFAPPDNRLGTQIFYYNYGKSPALHMNDVGWIFVGADQKLVDDWFKQLGDGPLETANLEPNDGHGSQRPFLTESVLMQGEKPVLTTLVSRATATSLDVGYIVAIRFQYFDTFGKRYWSDVCFQHLPGQNEEIGNRCMAHNEIH